MKQVKGRSLKMARVLIASVVKEYNGVRVLDNISLDVKDKTFTTILGPPGAGKTTLLRVVAGLEKVNEGKIYVGDTDVTYLMPKDRGTSIVFQDFVLYPHMKVFDNIAYPLKLKKTSKDEIKKKVSEMAQFLKIGDLLDREPITLSGGEMQRVAVARALIKEADVCLFDEPLTNLDYKLREDLRAEFKRMKAELGQTILYATPDPVDALAMSDYIAAINKGKIEQYGKVDELYNHPKNAFVGAYLGYPEMNLIECSLLWEGGTPILDAGPFKMTVPKFSSKLHDAPSELKLGIRPENIYVSEKAVEGAVCLEGLISEVIGSETILHLRIGEVLVKAFIPEIYRITPNAKLWIVLDLDKAHIFDRKTGEAIAQ